MRYNFLYKCNSPFRYNFLNSLNLITYYRNWFNFSAKLLNSFNYELFVLLVVISIGVALLVKSNMNTIKDKINILKHKLIKNPFEDRYE